MADQIDEYLQQVVIGDPADHREIVVVDYDPAWPAQFRREADRIRAALGDVILRLEHIGSTAVPGLAAKPIIDILLVVERSGAEDAYVPALEAAGYELRVREPDFDEHRMLRTPERDVHIHVLSPDSQEIARYLILRDRLRQDEHDRRRYAALKRDLATQSWPTMQHYSEGKTDLIEEIIAGAADEGHAD